MQGKGLFFHHFNGFFQSVIIQISGGGNIQARFEDAIEIAAINADEAGDIIDGNAVRIVILNIGNRFGKILRGLIGIFLFGLMAGML